MITVILSAALWTLTSLIIQDLWPHHQMQMQCVNGVCWSVPQECPNGVCNPQVFQNQVHIPLRKSGYYVPLQTNSIPLAPGERLLEHWTWVPIENGKQELQRNSVRIGHYDPALGEFVQDGKPGVSPIKMPETWEIARRSLQAARESERAAKAETESLRSTMKEMRKAEPAKAEERSSGAVASQERFQEEDFRTNGVDPREPHGKLCLKDNNGRDLTLDQVMEQLGDRGDQVDGSALIDDSMKLHMIIRGDKAFRDQVARDLKTPGLAKLSNLFYVHYARPEEEQIVGVRALPGITVLKPNGRPGHADPHAYFPPDCYPQPEQLARTLVRGSRDGQPNLKLTPTEVDSGGSIDAGKVLRVACSSSLGLFAMVAVALWILRS